MTNNTIPNVPRELKPCPFCGGTPELPNGYGTQYEIECGGCGQAKAGVQICDLMTLEERAADTFTDYRYGEEFIERAKVEAIERWNTRAPSPAGVDGLEGLLRHAQKQVPTGSGLHMRIDAALSAGKDGE